MTDPGEHPSGPERGAVVHRYHVKGALTTGVPTASSAEEQSSGGDGASGRKMFKIKNWQQLRESGGVRGLSCRPRTPKPRLKLCPLRGPARSRSRGHTVRGSLALPSLPLSLPPSLSLHRKGAGPASTPIATRWISQHLLSFLFI